MFDPKKQSLCSVLLHFVTKLKVEPINCSSSVLFFLIMLFSLHETNLSSSAIVAMTICQHQYHQENKLHSNQELKPCSPLCDTLHQVHSYVTGQRNLSKRSSLPECVDGEFMAPVFRVTEVDGGTECWGLHRSRGLGSFTFTLVHWLCSLLSTQKI